MAEKPASFISKALAPKDKTVPSDTTEPTNPSCANTGKYPAIPTPIPTMIINSVFDINIRDILLLSIKATWFM